MRLIEKFLTYPRDISDDFRRPDSAKWISAVAPYFLSEHVNRIQRGKNNEENFAGCVYADCKKTEFKLHSRLYESATAYHECVRTLRLRILFSRGQARLFIRLKNENYSQMNRTFTTLVTKRVP